MNDNVEELIINYLNCENIKKKHIFQLKILEKSLPYIKKIADNISIKKQVPKEDLIQLGSIGVIKAINSFSPDKNAKFKTYANYCIMGEISHYLRKELSLNIEDNKQILNEYILSEKNNDIDTIETKMMVSSAINKLPNDLKDIIEMNFYKDLSQNEIAQQLNISKMQVSRKLKKAISKIYEYIEV